MSLIELNVIYIKINWIWTELLACATQLKCFHINFWQHKPSQVWRFPEIKDDSLDSRWKTNEWKSPTHLTPLLKVLVAVSPKWSHRTKRSLLTHRATWSHLNTLTHTCTHDPGAKNSFAWATTEQTQGRMVTGHKPQKPVGYTHRDTPQP